MEKEREMLIKAIKTYFNYDLKSSNGFNDPSPVNSKYHKKVEKDAENIADLAIKILNHKKIHNETICECGFNHRMALDCTSKDCKHILLH